MLCEDETESQTSKGFMISSYIQIVCQLDSAFHKWGKHWKRIEARSSDTTISNIFHDVLLSYSSPLTVQVGWRRTLWNAEILDVREIRFHQRCKRWKFRLTKNNDLLNNQLQSVFQAWTFHSTCNQHFVALNFQHSIFDRTCRSNDMGVVVQCACFSFSVDPIF